MKYVRKIVNDYCILDLETTGLSTRYDEVIEIGILKVRNNEIVDQYQMLTKPKFLINEFISTKTGISNEMVKDKLHFKKLKSEVMKFIGNDIILGHNTNFDIAFLQNQFKQEYDNEYIDTVQLAKKVYPNFANYQLSYLAEQLKFPGNYHRSIDDCMTTKKLYDSIKAKLQSDNISLNDLYYNNYK